MLHLLSFLSLFLLNHATITLNIYPQDQINSVFIGSTDISSQFDLVSQNTLQSLIINIYPGDFLIIKVSKTVNGVFLYTSILYDYYDHILTNALNLWIIMPAKGLKTNNVLGKVFIGTDDINQAEFSMQVTFPGSCKNATKNMPSNALVSITLDELWSPSIYFDDWYLKLPIKFTNKAALGSFTIDGTEVELGKFYTARSYTYQTASAETKAEFSFSVNNYDITMASCKIVINYASPVNCYKDCNACTVLGRMGDHKCTSCKAGYQMIGSNCIKICDGKWHYVEIIQKECVDDCPMTYPLNIPATGECVRVCPAEFPISIIASSQCVAECTVEYPFYVEDNTECVNDCPAAYPNLVVDTKKCVLTCPGDYSFLIADMKECVKECTVEYPYEVDTLPKQCVSDCPMSHPLLVVNLKKCVLSCPNDYLWLISALDQCVDKCPDDYPLINDDIKQCTNSCSDPFPLLIPDLSKCVNACSVDYPLLIDLIKHCVNSCTGEFPLIVEDLNQCVQTCPSLYPIKLPLLSKCVNACPSDYPYLTEDGLLCVNSCPADFPFLFQSTKKCFKLCQRYNLFPFHDKCLTKDEIESELEIVTNPDNSSELVTNSTLEDLLNNSDIIINNAPGIIKGDDIVIVIKRENDTITGPSNVNLNECEAKLRKVYNIPSNESLIILIVDDMREENKLSNVTYIVYDHLYNRLDLKHCVGIDITIDNYIPPDYGINLDQAKDLESEGINVFNPEEEFFNSICFPYQNKEGYDITLNDRRNDVYQNVSLCQKDCVFICINYVTNQSICNCTIKENNSTDNDDDVLSTFINSIPSTNILIVQCYIRILDIKVLIKNIAFWVIMALLIIYLISFIQFSCCGMRTIMPKLNKYSDQMMNNSYIMSVHSITNNNSMHSMKKHGNIDEPSIIISKKKSKFHLSESCDNHYPVRTMTQTPTQQTQQTQPTQPTQGHIQQHTQSQFKAPCRPQRIEIQQSSNTRFKETNSDIIVIETKTKNNQSVFPNNNDLGEPDIQSSHSLKNNNQLNNSICHHSMNNQRCNNILQGQTKKFTKKKTSNSIDYDGPYSICLKHDKRSFMRILWDTIKYNYLFFQPFVSHSSYDCLSIKLGILIFTIVLELTINALFYDDGIVSEKYSTQSIFLFSSVLKSLYSCLLNTLLVSILIKQAEYQSILELVSKEYQHQDKYLKYVGKALKIVKRKTIVFFSIGLVLIIFGWYYCVVFCTIYHGSQISLFIDQAVSLGMMSIMTIIGSIVIAIMRYASYKKKKRSLYYVSLYLNRFF